MPTRAVWSRIDSTFIPDARRQALEGGPRPNLPTKRRKSEPCTPPLSLFHSGKCEVVRRRDPHSALGMRSPGEYRAHVGNAVIPSLATSTASNGVAAVAQDVR